MNNMVDTDYAVGTYSYVATEKNQTAGTIFKDKVESVPAAEELSEEEKLEAFKKEIWNKINSFSWNKCMNISIQITDGAFKRMMEDSDFKDRMLSIIQKESIAAQPPGNVSLTWIDESGYRGYSYIDNDAGAIAFQAHSNDKDSFYVKKAAKKQDYLELWEEKRLQQELQKKKWAEGDMKAEWQRRVLNEEAVEKKQEYSRQLHPANNGKQMSKASSVYEANIMTETTTKEQGNFVNGGKSC